MCSNKKLHAAYFRCLSILLNTIQRFKILITFLTDSDNNLPYFLIFVNFFYIFVMEGVARRSNMLLISGV